MKYIKVENFSANEKIKVVSLNRPEVKNAFHPEMIAEVTEFFQNAEADLIVLKGEGNVFCAGADLGWMQSMVRFSFDENIADSKKLWNMFAAIQNCAAPVIGWAHGAVFGGALGLLACCDYVWAEEKTQFCFSEVKLGLAPAVITGFIRRKIPDAFCRPLMISGEVFGTQEAKNAGLIHHIYGTTLQLEHALKGFMANGPEAMRETKKLLNTLLETEKFSDVQNHCTRVIAERRTSQEGQARLQQFLSKTGKA